MLDANKKKEILQRILSSDTFAGSSRHQELLKYLFQQYTKGIIPKESNIAQNVFNRLKNFDSQNDTIVRASIYQLRSRLEQYYEKEGLQEKIHITIPKGQYHIEFASISKTKISTKLLIFTSLVFFISSGFFAYNYFLVLDEHQGFHKKYQIVPHTNPLWAEFYDNNKILVIIGDYFFLQEPSKLSPLRYLREDAINSLTDLEKAKNLYKEEYGNYYKAPDSFLGYHSVLSLEKILPSILYNELDTSIRILSQVSFQDIVDNNVIFIGSLKTIGILDRFLIEGGLELEVATPENRNIYIDVKKSKGDTLISPSRYSFGGVQEDCSIIAKFNGPNNKKILIFAGIHHIGIMQAIDNFISIESRKNLLQEMQEQFGKVPSSFVALYRVTGYDKVNTTSVLISLVNVDN